VSFLFDIVIILLFFVSKSLFSAVEFALQPKPIRQTLLKERFKNGEVHRSERHMEHYENGAFVRNQLLYYQISYGAGLNHAVCMNTFRNLYGIFRKSWGRISRACSNYYAGPIIHGNTGCRNRFSTSSVAVAQPSVVLFLSSIAEEHGDSYATRFIREVTGMSLTDTEEGRIDLPSFFSKRHLYAQYCYSRGYKVHADAKGSYGSLSEYDLREFDDHLWLEGTKPLPVCAWVHFLCIWKSEFPHLKIRNACEDTCGECVKLKNTFYALDKRPPAQPEAVDATASTIDSINDLGPSEDGNSVTSSQFSSDGVNDVNADRFSQEEFPVEALVLEASRHAIQAQKQRFLASSRIRDAKETLASPWEDRWYVVCACVFLCRYSPI